MEKQTSRKVWIENEHGERLEITLQDEGGTLLGTVLVDKVPYHVFFASWDELSAGGRYVLDGDPSYRPKPSPSGLYPLIAPYSE